MMEQEQFALAAILVGGVVVMLLVSLAIYAVVCFLVFSLLKAVPKQHQKMQPGLVWLLMIPCFNLVWNFVVFPKLSQSYESCLTASGDTSAGNCYAGLAWALPVLVVLPYVPCLGWLGLIAFLAAVAVLVAYLVLMFGLKKRIEGQA